MTPQRATDNIQQKAGQFVGRTLNEWSMRAFDSGGMCTRPTEQELRYALSKFKMAPAPEFIVYKK